MNFAIYVAGYVDGLGGEIQLKTVHPDEALRWTAEHQIESRVSVMRGYTHEEIARGESYMCEIMSTHVLGFDGQYTPEYAKAWEEEGCFIRNQVGHTGQFCH